MNSPILSTVFFDTTEIREGLRRRGLPDSHDSLSRCISALFAPGEIAQAPRDDPHQRGGTGYAFTKEQAELVWTAAELVYTRTFSLKYLRILRRFARMRGEDDLTMFQDFLTLARVQNGQADDRLLGRTA